MNELGVNPDTDTRPVQPLRQEANGSTKTSEVSPPAETTAVAWDDPRVVALSRRLCRYKDCGGPCEGPGNDCDADNCRTVERAVKEVTHAN